jgi:enoyl-CoA hydratase
MIETTREGEVAVLRLCHGKSNALDLELCEALERALGVEERGDARALVLTGTGGIFCAGVDLRRLLAEGPSYVARFLPALDALFLRILRLEKPLVGALNGHAIAGGAVIAGGCDLRLFARGNGTIAVPELKVGVPFPATAVELARELFPPALLGQALYLGRAWKAEECLAAGIVDELVEPAELAGRALERARELAAVPGASFALTKRLRRRSVLEQLERHAARDAAQTLALWSSAETLAAVDAFVQRTLRRPSGP